MGILAALAAVEIADRQVVPGSVVGIVDKLAVSAAVETEDRKVVRELASASAVETVDRQVASAFVAPGLAVRIVDRAVDIGDMQAFASAFVVETAGTLVVARLA